MKPKDILQIGEDFPLVTGVENALPGDTLVEDIVQNLQRADVSSLGVKELCREREKQDCINIYSKRCAKADPNVKLTEIRSMD